MFDQSQDAIVISPTKWLLLAWNAKIWHYLTDFRCSRINKIIGNLKLYKWIAYSRLINNFSILFIRWLRKSKLSFLSFRQSMVIFKSPSNFCNCAKVKFYKSCWLTASQNIYLSGGSITHIFVEGPKWMLSLSPLTTSTTSFKHKWSNWTSQTME
jgi:hypothetical protein